MKKSRDGLLPRVKCYHTDGLKVGQGAHLGVRQAAYTLLLHTGQRVSRSFSSRWPSRRGTNLALIGHFLIIVKLEDHDIRAPIFGMEATPLGGTGAS
jgi:hypothetical protein